MNPMFNQLSRRAALKSTAAGFGYLAFAGLSTLAAEKDNPLSPKKTHFPARAKHVIFLCMEGGPSQVDSFDYKPKLTADDGKSMPGTPMKTAVMSPPSTTPPKLLASPWKFKQFGQSGLWVSELFPKLSAQADELCVLRGMHTDLPAHPAAFLQMHTGISQSKRPSLGAWTYYGLGTDNENLPGFVTLRPSPRNGGQSNYGSAFLPAYYQGTPIGAGPAEPAAANIGSPTHSTDAQRRQLDLVQSLNRAMLERDPHNPDAEGAIQSLELAFRMQMEMPMVMDLAKESAATKALYGIGEKLTDDFGRQCLLARRLVEAGVRFVEINSSGWDHHRDLKNVMSKSVAAVDQPIAGLITDLKSRGLLEDTLILWGGEFGRTPYAQGSDGRDHNNKGFTTWMAGGGVKGGFAYGSTDDYGYEAVEGKVHIHDWHATILHLLGLDHEKLIYRYAGRDMRLTDIRGNVVKDIIG